MSLLTLWGYTITSRDSLPDMISEDSFSAFTGNEFQDAERIEAEMAAASAAVRNYVGWHLYPSAECQVNITMQDRRITRIGSDLLIQLPAKFVTAVSSVSLEGKSLSFTFETNGLLRCYDVSACARYSVLTANYTAGLPDNMMAPINELVAHRIKHAMAVPSGITSEASGGVSVTYNAAWINSAQSTTMQDTNKELLAPYTLRGVF